MKVIAAIGASFLFLGGCVTYDQLSAFEENANTESAKIDEERRELGGKETSANSKTARVTPALSATTSSLDRLSLYGALLSQSYQKLADRSQTERDITTVALIAYAADAATDALGDASASNLGERAIAGTAFSETAAYLNPATATGGLLLGAKRAICISNVAAAAKSDGVDSFKNRAFVVDGYAQTQLDVRSSLRGVAPDYAALAAKFSEAVKKSEENLARMGLAKAAEERSKINVEQAVDSCLLTGAS